MNGILSNKEWVFSGIGVFALSLVVSVLVWSVSRIRLTRHGMGRFVGTYEVYQCGIKERTSFMKGVIRIGSVWRGLPVVYTSHRNTYRGRLRSTGQNLFIELAGVDIQAWKYCVFVEPMADFEALVGVTAAITAFRQPFAGKIVLKRCHDSAAILPAVLPEREVP